MAHSVILSNGNTALDIELVYDAVTQTDYKLRYGMSVTADAPEVVLHKPDDGEPLPVRANDVDRTAFLTLIVDGTDRDDLQNNLITLKRWVDGADQQALRYWTHGDVDRIDLVIQLDTQTNATRIPVKWGVVDDGSGALYSAASLLNDKAIDAAIMLRLAPYGEGSTITLRNDLASTPHFIEDSDADGLADGWVELGTPTTSIGTTNYLTGAKSQHVVTGASGNEGIVSDIVTIAQSSNIVAFAWVYVTGGDAVYVTLTDGASTLIDELEVTAGNASSSHVDVAGATWYKIDVSGTNSGAADARLHIRRRSGDATQTTTFDVDDCYLETSQTTVPTAWMSTASIENRYDPTSSNESRINYLDFWGVPGDATALLRLKATIGLSATDRERLIWSGYADGVHLAPELGYWQEQGNSAFATANNGSWSDVSDATRSNGDYIKFTASGGTGDGTTLVSTSNRILFKYPLRMFILCRASSTAVNISVEVHFVGAADTTVFTSTVVNVTNTATWEMIDLGLLNFAGVFPENFPSPGIQTQIIVSIDSVPNGGTFSHDVLLLLPALWDYGIFESTEPFSNGDVVWLDGHQSIATIDTTGFAGDTLMQPDSPRISSYGMTRYVLALIEDDDGYTLTDTHSVTAEIIPRTRHLLGTV